MHTGYNLALASWVWFALTAWSAGAAAQMPTQPAMPAQTHFRFTENAGQWNPALKYKADIPGGFLFLEGNRLAYAFHNVAPVRPMSAASGGQASHAGACTHAAAASPDPWVGRWQAHGLPDTVRSHVFHVNFLGASQATAIVPKRPFSETENFFLGDDPKRWASGVKSYEGVELQELYPGIDLVVYSENQTLKYDFNLKPGADPSLLQLHYDGAERLWLDAEGQLNVQTSLNRVVEAAPTAYQPLPNGQRQAVPCQFALRGQGYVTFIFPDGYDRTLPLVIDPPVLVFSTYSGSTADSWGFTATYDFQGNLYGGGIVLIPQLGAGYPTTPGAFQTTFAGGAGPTTEGLVFGCDVAITKLNPTGTARLYSTYLGGLSNEAPHSMWADGSGNLYVMGTTRSGNFPTTSGAYDQTLNGDIDLFITKFNASGSALLASTFVGGANADGVNLQSASGFANPLYVFYADDSRGEIILDKDGKVYVATCTRSVNFPTTSGAYATTWHASAIQMGAVMRLSNDLSILEWSTLLGQTAHTACFSMKVDGSGKAVVVGSATGSVVGSFAPSWGASYHGGVADGFAAKLSTDGSTLLNFAYIGTPQHDMAYFAEVDDDKNVFVAGLTQGPSFPIANVGFSVPGGGQYILKLDSNLANLVYSTRYGAGSNQFNITPTAFLVDKCGNVYVSGWGGSLGGSTTGLPVTANAFKPTTNGDDVYLIVLATDIASLEYATFYGDDLASDHVDGGTSRFDREGIVYQSVCASCGPLTNSGFPTTPGVVGPQDLSDNCNNGLFKFEFDVMDAAIAGYNFTITSTQGCAPYTVQFNNLSLNGASYDWDFGDGTTSAQANPIKVFAQPGTYQVKLVVENPGSCNLADSVTQTIAVYAQPTASFIRTDNDCDFIVSFQNNSTNAVDYLWQFGDGNTSTMANPTHTYSTPGTYTVRLTVNPSLFCTDFIELQIRVGLPPHLDFGAQPSFCALGITTSNNTLNATTYVWDFGDGTVLAGTAPPHTYSDTGFFWVRLTAEPGTGCQTTDSVLVEIDTTAFAHFSYAFPPCSRTGTFLQQSDNAVSYLWDFDAGVAIGQANPTFTFPAGGFYTATLTINQFTACEDSVSRQVYVPFVPDANFSFANTLCSPDVSFSNLTTEGLVYLWDFGGLGTSANANPVFSFPQTGTYTVVLIANPDSACTDSHTLEVFVQIQTIANFEMPDTLCGLDVPIQNTSFNQLTQLWQFFNLGAASPFDSRQNLPPSYVFPGFGTYEVLLTTNPSGDCPDTHRDTVLLPDYYPAEFLTIPTDRCGFEFRFIGLAPAETPVLWNFGPDGQTSTLAEPVFTFPQPEGQYSVVYTTHPGGICADSIARSVQAGALFAAQIALPDTICGPYVAPRNLTEGPITYAWTFGDGSPVNPNPLPVHAYQNPGTYEVQLVVDEGTLCQSVDSQFITVMPRPKANFAIAQEMCSGLLSFTNTSTGAVSYQWIFGDGTTSSEAEPVKVYADVGEKPIRLVAFEANGCTDTLLVEYNYDPTGVMLLFLPNAFTPNGDGVNDLFGLVGQNMPCIKHFSVFDRWGNLIFTTDDPAVPWNGMRHDAPAPEGAYVYVVRTMKDTERAGTVTLLR